MMNLMIMNMTREKNMMNKAKGLAIDEMPAGPEMDALMAEAMGWKQLSRRLWHDTNGHERWIDGNMSFIHQQPRWSPSTDIAAAWEAVKHFHKKGYISSLRFEDDRHSAWFALPGDFTSNLYASMPLPVGEAGSAPLAICRACLKVT